MNKKAPARWPGLSCCVTRVACCVRYLTLHEFRVGFHTAVCDIHAFVLFLFADTDAHDRFQDAPHDQAGNEYPDEDGSGTDQLTREAHITVGYRYQHQAQETHHTVYGDCTYRIVDLQLVQSQDAEDYQHTTQGTEQSRLQRARQ